MDKAFWAEMQKLWRVTMSEEDKDRVTETSKSVVKGMLAQITKRYSKNPLDDDDDEEEEDDEGI